jgi:Domain of unknown function (DUF4351)
MTTLPIDHDRLFKDLISTFFLEFLELFVPTLASLIEPDSITFREQEYFADWAEGETNIVDQMRIEERDRPKVKAECLRLLVTLQLNPAKTQLISQFVDSYLRLNQTEEEVFQTEIDTMGLDQKEAIMQTLTSWEERGMEKGVEQGVEKGVEKERRSLVSLLLEQKFGELPPPLTDRVNALSPEQLKDLAIALLRFETIDDLTAWLADRG